MDCSLRTGFSGPKRSRDFRETGPWYDIDDYTSIHLWVSKERVLLSSVVENEFIFRVPRPAGNHVYYGFVVFEETLCGSDNNIWH